MQKTIQHIRKLIYHLHFVQYDIVEFIIYNTFMNMLKNNIRVTQILVKAIIQCYFYYMVFTYSCFNQMIVKQVEEKKRFATSSNSSYNLYEIV